MGEIGHYLDASFLVALLTVEASGAGAVGFARAHPAGLIVSDFAAAEFASAISRRVRMRQMPDAEGGLVFSAFDHWTTRAANTVAISPRDIAVAATFLRRLDLVLRTPDAIHLAATQRLGAALVTLDLRMAAVARTLDIAVAEV